MTPEQLQQIAPRCPKEMADELVQALPHWDIGTPLREAAFMAQVAVESAELTATEENLRYTVTGLMRAWPHRFPSIDAATPYAQNPEKLANYVYADSNRDPAHALGNVNPGDGWMFRGRGLIQLTGRANYRAAGLALALPLEEEPERVARPSMACEVAGWFWYSRGCNDLADKGAEAFEAITRKVNGGLLEHDRRVAYYVKAKEALGL